MESRRMFSKDEIDSIWLFDVLDIIGANDEFRKTCQRLRIMGEINLTFQQNISIYVCGSAYEGSYTPDKKYDPDFDSICCYEPVSVIEDISKASGQNQYSLLAITEEDTFDGYIKLQLVVNGTRTTVKDLPYLQQFVREQNIIIGPDRNGQLVLLDWPNLHLPKIYIKSKNKPAVTVGKRQMDTVMCYRCRTWPTIAEEWLTRRRCYGWPTENTIQEMKSFGFFVIKKGRHPSSEERELEWRITFSLQERKLMLSLTDVQHKCYIVLKMFNRNIIKLKGVTSYHWKTCLFYVMEENDRNVWKKEHLFYCVKLCIKQMLKWVNCEFCPNYFIPGDNLFDGKLNKSQGFKAAKELANILNMGFDCFLHVQTSNISSYVESRKSLKRSQQLQSSSRNNYKMYLTYVNLHCYTSLQINVNGYILQHYFDQSNENTSIFIKYLWDTLHHIKRVGTVTEHTEEETRSALSFLVPHIFTYLASNISAIAIQHPNQQVRDFLLFGSFTLFMQAGLPGRLKFISVLYALHLYEDCEWFLDQLDENYIKIVPTVCFCRSVISDKKKTFLNIFHTSNSDVVTCICFLPSELRITPHAMKYEMFRHFGINLDENVRSNAFNHWHYTAVVDSNTFFFFLKHLVKMKLGKNIECRVAREDLLKLVSESTNVKHFDVGCNLIASCFCSYAQSFTLIYLKRSWLFLIWSWEEMIRDKFSSTLSASDLKRTQYQFNAAKLHALVLLYNIWFARKSPEINFCFNCLVMTFGKQKACNMCQIATYCSAKCKRDNWKIHKDVCKIIVLKNDKHYMLHLDEYGYEGHGNDIPEECRISRTKFIHWARDVKRIPIVSKDLATTSFDEIKENEGELDAEDAVQSINVNKPNTANGSIGGNVHVSPVTEIKKDNGSVGLNSPLDQSVIEPTVQTAEKTNHTVGSMNEPDTQGNTNPMVMSEDEPAIQLAIETIDAVGDDNINPELESGETNCEEEASIESNGKENCREGMDNPIKNLIGRNIKVHIQNVIEPAKERKTRELDTEHVTALEEQFKKELNLYTVLIGHLPEKLELDQLEIPGRAVVEVLGGNHTRQALMNIGKTNMLLSMDLYMSLSNEQALRLGLKHNDIHRLSRQTTFEESIKLFREVLFRIKEQKPHMKPKDISAEWRLNVASIMDTPKSKINKYQTHLHCASLPDQVWEKLIDLFKSWRNQTVKDQPCHEIKQTHLFHLFRVHNEVDKIRLLDELACGKTTFQEFKDQCLKGKVENMAASHTIKKPKGQKKKSKAVDNTPLKEDDVLRDNLITEILELKNKIKLDEMATENMKSRHDNLEKNNRELENKYTEELTQNESMKNQIKNLTDSLSSMEKRNKDLTEELDMVKDIFKTEKKKSDDVERSITHALNETEKKQSDKIYQLQEHIKEKDLKIESLHLQLNMVNDAANRARNEVREIAKKRPHELTEDTEDIRPDTQTKKMKATTDAITVSEETIDISQNEEIAMVEYNNENVYLGVLQDSMLTFTRQPLGKLGPDFVIKDLNFSLNKKDRQLINSAYIIANIKCKIVKNKFTINEEQKKDLEKSVKKYLAGKNTKNVADKDSLKN